TPWPYQDTKTRFWKTVGLWFCQAMPRRGSPLYSNLGVCEQSRTSLWTTPNASVRNGNASTSMLSIHMCEVGQPKRSDVTMMYAGRSPSVLLMSSDGRPGTQIAEWTPVELYSDGVGSKRERSRS